MPWQETEELNRRLHEALSELAAEKGALVRLAGALNADPRATATDTTRRGGQHQDRKDLIAASTLARWQQEGLARLTNAQSHKKRIVFEFLERSESFRTSIYNPAPGLPEGFAAFIAAQQKTLSQLRFSRLNNLDGTYRLYRRAWTTPARRDRVLISRLIITTVGGLTRYREEQTYRDEARGGILIEEADEGLVFNSGTNLFLFGFGEEEPRVKFYAIHAWRPMIDGNRPVQELRGTVIAVAWEGPHPGYSFVAHRADDPAFEPEVVPASSVDLEICVCIGCHSEP